MAVTTIRFYETLLQSERALRAQAEEQLRRYGQLMQTLVHQLGFLEMLDNARHLDPEAPKNWTFAQWEQFWKKALARRHTQTLGGWGKAPSGNGNGVNGNGGTKPQPSLQQIQQLQGRIAELEAEIQRLRANAVATKGLEPEQNFEADGSVDWLDTRVSQIRALAIPPRTQVPVSLRDTLGTAQRYRREVQILWLLGQGHNIRLEIDWVISQVNEIKPRSGSIRRTFERMAESGLIEAETLRLLKPRTSLALVRLTDTGRAVAQALFGEEPHEGEWERLQRLHEGERFPEHTVAVLLFALHARLRGWTVAIMPEVDGAAPDAVVWRGQERFYVEVERGKKDKPAKWANIAQANGGKVALCAMTPQHRALLVGDCKRQRLPGVATDLETLINVPWHKARNEPLWIEEWEA